MLKFNIEIKLENIQDVTVRQIRILKFNQIAHNYRRILHSSLNNKFCTSRILTLQRKYTKDSRKEP